MDAQKERRGMYAKIAIARRQLPLMDEDAYRALLSEEFGERSATRLTRAQLARLLRIFAEMGVRYSSRGTNRTVTAAARPDWIEVPDSAPHAAEKRQILAIWRKLGYSMTSLDTRIKRAFGIHCFVWLQNGEQISTLLSDLQRREKSFDRKRAAHA